MQNYELNNHNKFSSSKNNGKKNKDKTNRNSSKNSKDSRRNKDTVKGASRSNSRDNKNMPAKTTRKKNEKAASGRIGKKVSKRGRR